MENCTKYSETAENFFCNWFSIPLETEIASYDGLKSGILLMKLLSKM